MAQKYNIEQSKEDIELLVKAETEGVLQALVRLGFLDSRYTGRLKVLIIHHIMGGGSENARQLMADMAGMDRGTLDHHLKALQIAKHHTVAYKPRNK